MESGGPVRAIICNVCYEAGKTRDACQCVLDNGRANRHQGIEEGLRRFAWWKDGRENVGTCGTSLMTAIRDLDKEYGFKCPHRKTHDDDGCEYCSRCGISVEKRPIDHAPVSRA